MSEARLSDLEMHEYGQEEGESSSTTAVAIGVRKGAWTTEEDILLRQCIEKYGEGNWRLVPRRAGLNRCRKSCRLRWLNYLRPNINRGRFAPDEVDLIIKLHRLLGNRWSLIAKRLPGRTENDVKNYWNTHLQATESSSPLQNHSAADQNAAMTTTTSTENMTPKYEIIKPQLQTLKKGWTWFTRQSSSEPRDQKVMTKDQPPTSGTSESFPTPAPMQGEDWWEHLSLDNMDEIMDMSCISNTEYCWNGSGSGSSASRSWLEVVGEERNTGVNVGPIRLEDMDRLNRAVDNDFSLDEDFWSTMIVAASEKVKIN